MAEVASTDSIDGGNESAAVEAAPHTSAAALVCANCDQGLAGHYCSHCGQEAAIELPSLREFFHELTDHSLAFEGKLARSVWLLISAPGRLTREYLAGRRQRYVRPLRLYLTLSVFFFLALNIGSQELVKVVSHGDNGVELRAEAGSPAAGVSAKGGLTLSGNGDSGSDTTGSAFVDRRLSAFSKLSGDEQARHLNESIKQYAPYAVFILMPIFAAGLQLLYWRRHRRYGEHLLFATHFHAFAYLALLLAYLGGISLLSDHEAALSLLVVLSVSVYLFAALRQVYGGRRWTTLARMTVLACGYCLALIVVLGAGTVLAILL